MEEIEQHWLYALSSPMAALNGASYTSPQYFDGEADVDLEKWWGISDRTQLLNTLRMADNGHAEALNTAYWRFQRCLPSAWQTLLESLSPRERILHDYAARTFGDCGFGGTRAWDLGRMGFLLRCGVFHRWISLEESLWLHGRLAVRARHFYNSWSSYLAGYMIGKSQWNCANDDDEQFALDLERQGADHWNRCIVFGLANGAEALFGELPWDLPLDLPERPETLEEGTWS